MTAENWIDSDGTTVIRTIAYIYNDKNQLETVSDPDSTYAYTYDDAGQVLTIDNSGTPDMPDVTLTQSYDGLGNLASLNANVAGTSLFTNSYTNDALGQVTQVTQSGSGVSDKGATFAYNPLGQFTSVATFASTTTSDPISSSAYGYDDANQLTSLTQTKSSDSSTIAAYGFTYDADGQLTAETSPDGSIAYTYDHDGRLTGASGTGLPASQDYAYDANNNRTSTTVGSTTNTGIATAGNNQLSTDGTYDYAYDPDGNLITKTTISTGATENFAWDYRNRLTDITYKNSEGTTTQHIHYTYDVFNRRITQEIDSTGSGTYDQVEHYVYDPTGNLLMTLDGTGAVTHVFLNGPASNQVLADDAGSGNVTWLLADQQGSVRDVLDVTGAVIDHIKYDPYGNILSQSSPTDQPRFLYAGMQLDSTGFYFDNARYYDPSTGSFISTDPAAFAGSGTNLYAYVENDPVNLIDPTGTTALGTVADWAAEASAPIEGALASLTLQIYSASALRQAYSGAVSQLPATSGVISPYRTQLQRAAWESQNAWAQNVVNNELETRAINAQSRAALAAQAAENAIGTPAEADLAAQAGAAADTATRAAQKLESALQNIPNGLLADVDGFKSQANEIVAQAWAAAGESASEGAGEIGSALSGLRANVSNVGVNSSADTAELLGKAGIGFAIGADLYRIIEAPPGQTALEVGGAAARWAGTLAGAEAGAAVGLFVGGPIGGIVGGVLGGAFGAFGGQKAFNAFRNSLKS